MNNTTTTTEIEIVVSAEQKLDILAELRGMDQEAFEAFEQQNSLLIQSIEQLEKEIKADCLEAGESIKGESLMAVWVGGKTTWDGKILKGLEAVYPELAKAKKIGNPTVSFRKVA